MVSDFRRAKILRGFQFFDADKSGVVEKADFDLALKKIAEKRGLEESNPKYQNIKTFLLDIWEGIQKQADADNDGKVTADEWIQVWSNFASSPADWQIKTARFLFDTLDTGSDGVITAEEFSKVTQAFGRPKEETEVAFQKISKGKPSINFDDFLELYKEYYSADDKEAAGNFIFGRTKFD